MTPARPPAVSDAMPTTRGLNFFLEDRHLNRLCLTVMGREVYERARPHLVDLGAVAGDELDALAAQADRHPPVLRPYDERGARVDAVDFHPAYHAMEQLAFCRFGLAAMSHVDGVLGWPGRVPHVVKYALSYLFAQSEFGLLCPVNMTDSTARMLRRFGSAGLQETYVPRLTTLEYERLWQGTQWMTEKTGGSDVGALTTVARRDGDGTWRLWGDKWFCSNANTDMAVTLARPEGAVAGTKGLGMFLVSRRLPDGTKNAWTINRLKDKLGSRSMATGEVTFSGAVAYVVGDVERGFHQMMEMVNSSRLSNAMRAAAIMRRALLESVVHARGRAAFGSALADKPLLRQNLLEMLLDSEAAAAVVLHGAAMFDGWDAGDAQARTLLRIVTPLAKGWITARARVVAGEAMNIRGGNGYVEEWVNARLLRDSYLGAIWEGSTNVVALDVQRAIVKDGCLEPLAAHVLHRLEAVTDPGAKTVADAVRATLSDVQARAAAWPALPAPETEVDARPVAEALYHILAGSLLLGHGQALAAEGGDHHALLVAALYVRRYLRPPAPPAPLLPARALEHLGALIDGTPVPAEALAGDLLGHS
ncbi:MAG TPA: acyl-CoA dehydrogenase family protein [Candidatus Limnocylindria bacterium]|nr:acyl-CoA dehydrogenase family protein [Candidatus Limnocylindria bacterium]